MSPTEFQLKCIILLDCIENANDYARKLSLDKSSYIKYLVGLLGARGFDQDEAEFLATFATNLKD